MKYTETGFRAIVERFTVFPLVQNMREALADFPGVDTSNAILLYGYIDRDEGVMLEVIACGIRTGDLFRFHDSNDGQRCAIKSESLCECDFFILSDDNGELLERYGSKVKALEEYEPGDEIRETRNMRFLDSSRDLFKPDEVKVSLVKRGKAETVNTRITGLGDTYIVGELLDDSMEFSLKKGTEIGFFVQSAEGGRIILTANMDNRGRYTKEELTDGMILRKAISSFRKNRNDDTYLDVLEILKVSDLWIPCEVSMKDSQLKMDPKFIERGGNYYLPAFSGEELMGTYADKYAKVRKSTLECFEIADAYDEISGVAVDPFDEWFILGKERFSTVSSMESILKEK